MPGLGNSILAHIPSLDIGNRGCRGESSRDAVYRIVSWAFRLQSSSLEKLPRLVARVPIDPSMRLAQPLSSILHHDSLAPFMRVRYHSLSLSIIMKPSPLPLPPDVLARARRIVFEGLLEARSSLLCRL